MEKVYGATERHDQLLVFGKTKRAVIIYGYGEENGQGYDYRQEFSYIPTTEEVRNVIFSHIDNQTGQRILSGFSWNGTPVWLSAENQFDYKAAYDLAVQTDGENLPVKFKFGTPEAPTYHEFTSVEELHDFWIQAFTFINDCLKEGWSRKDEVNWDDYTKV